MASSISLVIFYSLALSGIMGTLFAKQEVTMMKETRGLNLAKLKRRRVDDFGLKDGGYPIEIVPISRVNQKSQQVVSTIATKPYQPRHNLGVHVKTIKTKHGVYDCINFYKQPTFNHPLLRKHKSKALVNLAEFQEGKSSEVGFQNDACPVGTVPILRSHSDAEPSSVDIPHSSWIKEPKKHCVGVVHTNNLSWKLYGAAGGLSLHKPAVTDAQWSSARIRLYNGNEHIEAGWMVNPSIFKDREAHLYAKFVSTRSECINLQCPGFVQVSTNVPLGTTPQHYSKVRGEQWFWNVSIAKSKDDGHWWLHIGRTEMTVGYWPQELFTTLANYSNQVEWGGEIDNPGLTRPVPEMGNGYLATYDTKASATVYHATIVDDNHNSVTPGEDTHKVWDCEELYTVKDADYKGEILGRLFFYGGPEDDV